MIPWVAPPRLYVIEAVGASGVEQTYMVKADMQAALDEGEVLANTGARVRVLVYLPDHAIFVQPNPQPGDHA